MTLIERFREHAAGKRLAQLEAEAMRLERDEKKLKDEHHKREEREKQEREEFMLATALQIETFNHELDDADAATVRALMINQEKLDAIRLRLDRSEAAAFHLDDRRAVFRTADGQHVFDMSSTELPRDVIRREDIPEGSPIWESRKADLDAERDASRLSIKQKQPDLAASVSVLHVQGDGTSRWRGAVRLALTAGRSGGFGAKTFGGACSR